MSEPVISVNSTLGPTVEVLSDGDILINVATPVSGTGDVTSSSTSLDNQITRFDGTSGKVIQNSGITIADGASGTLSGTNSGDVTIGTANGLSIAGQALSLATASGSTTGALTSSDWTTFNSKQASGNYITALTGDVTASGPGSAAATLANTAVTPGAYTNANIAVDSKGRITAAANGSGGTVTSVGIIGTDGIQVDSGSPVTTSGDIQLGVDAAAMKTTLNLAGTNTGDQNLFGIIAVAGQGNVVADTTNDTLTLVAGSNITITTNPTTDAITINSTATATGDVVGPASSTDNALVRFDSTTGKLIQNGQITESDTGDLAAVNSIAMDTTPSGSLTTQGQMMWNADEETLDIQLNGFALHVGEHVVYHVKNNTASTIAKGVPVMFAGTTGNSGKLLIKPWDGVGPATLFMGLTGESLTTGSEGFVIAFGKLRGIQTNGANYGQTWADGEIVYAGLTSGSLTDTVPSAPNPIVQVLAVVHAHASNGTVFIRPNYTTGDVFGPSSATDGNVAVYDGTTGKVIKNGPAISAGGNGAADDGKLAAFDASGGLNAAVFTSLGVSSSVVLDENGFRYTDTSDGSFSWLNQSGLVLSDGTTTGTLLPPLGGSPDVNMPSTTGTLVSTGDTGTVTNTMLANSAITINGTPVSLGGSTTIATGITIGSTVITGGTSGRLLTSGTTVGEQTLGTNVATSLANNMSASGTLAILGANTFTATQTITPAANTNALAVSGYSLTGSNASALLNLAGTWNTSGTPSAIFCNITDTASNASSLLLQLQTGGVNRAVITKTGLTTLGSSAIAGGGSVLALSTSYGTSTLSVTGGGQLSTSAGISSAGTISAPTFALGLLEMQTDANYEIGLRRGTNAAKLSVYNTFTSLTNFERFAVDWKTIANTCRVGTEKGSGGGTARAMNLMTDATARAVFEATTFNTTLLASAGSYGSGSGVLFLGNATTAPTTDPTGGGILYVEASSLKFRGESGGNNTLAILGANTFTGAQTLSANGAASTPSLSITGTIFTGGTGTTTTPQLLVMPSSGVTTNTAWNTSGTALGLVLPDASGGNFLQLRRSNTNLGTIAFNGRMQGFEAITLGGSGLQCYNSQSNAANESAAGRTILLGAVATGLRMSSGYTVAWSSNAAGSADAFNNNDLIIRRDAAGILAQRNGTNAQSLRIYNTFTSATNYELASIGWATDILSIGTEKGSGGGTARAMQIVTDGTSRVNIGAAGEIGLYGVTAVARATTAGAAATFVTNTSGILNDTATFDGYTIGQVIKALRNVGILT